MRASGMSYGDAWKCVRQTETQRSTNSDSDGDNGLIEHGKRKVTDNRIGYQAQTKLCRCNGWRTIVRIQIHTQYP